MNRLVRDFLRLYWKSALDVAPLAAVILLFQIVVVREPFAEPVKLLAGFFLLVTGLFLFMRGFNTGLFPLGQSMTFQFAEKGNIWWLLAFCGLIAYSATIAEPTLISLAAKAEQLSGGRYDAFWLRNASAIGVMAGVVIGVLRITLGHPIQNYYIAGYTVVTIVTMFAPEGIIGIAFDFGGAALSTVSVPLLSAMGMGLASTIGGRHPMLDGFGIIGFAGMTPMIAIMIYGVIVS
jgi:hypothetical protein